MDVECRPKPYTYPLRTPLFDRDRMCMMHTLTNVKKQIITKKLIAWPTTLCTYDDNDNDNDAWSARANS